MRLTLAALLLLSTAPLATAQTTPPSPKTYRITYIQGVTGNPFYMSVTCGGAEAARRLGVTFDAQRKATSSHAVVLRGAG